MNCTLLDRAIKEKSSDKMHKKMKFSIKDFLSKFSQIYGKMCILSDLLKFF